MKRSPPEPDPESALNMSIMTRLREDAARRPMLSVLEDIVITF